MKASYYRCSIEEYGDVIIGILSDSNYQAFSVSPGRHDPDALILKLYQSFTSSEETPMTRLIPVDPEDLPDKDRLNYQGHLIEVGYPWGSEFIDQLEGIAGQLDLDTYQDPFKEGSDSFGILVGRSQDVWEVAPLLDERAEYCDEHPDDEDAPWTMEEAIEEACQKHSVIWLDTDWKHFEVDLDDFATLGIEAERVEPVVLAKPEELLLENILLFGQDRYITFNILFSEPKK